MKASLTLPYIAWREGRPRFVPGARERALGFKGRDLRHEDGRWFSLAEAEAFAQSNAKEIIEKRKAFPHAKAPPAKGSQRGFVYFLRCGDWIKVGFSTRPGNRLADLATSQPHTVTAIVIVPGERRDEQRVHFALKPARLSGEWFSYTPEVAAIMARSMAFGRPMTDAIGTNAEQSVSKIQIDQSQSLTSSQNVLQETPAPQALLAAQGFAHR